MRTLRLFVLTLAIAMICLVSISNALAEADEVLSARQKGIIPIAAFTASGNMLMLEKALHKGLDAGLTVNEIKEILVQTYAYAGFPRAINGINMFMAVVDERQRQGINDKVGEEATPIPDDFDRIAYGHKIRNSLVGRDMSNPTGGYQVFTPIIDRFLVEHLFAGIFYRDVLTHQERQLVTISVLAAMNGTGPQLKSHLGVSMNVGLSQAQLRKFTLVLRQEVRAGSAERATEALHDILGTDDPANQTKPLKVIRDQNPTKGSANYFTGNVTVESRFSSEISDSYQGGMVNFNAGARTAWHTHPLGQTLIVASGRGIVQAEGEAAQEILPGDVVWIPGNVRHWHGAAPDSPMSHVAISDSLNGSTVRWMEHVTDEQYAR